MIRETISYLTYDPETGEILGTGWQTIGYEPTYVEVNDGGQAHMVATDPGPPPLAAPMLAFDPEDPPDPRLHMINLATLARVNRPASSISLDKTSIAADELDEAVLSGIPAGSLVHARGETVEVDDGTLEISAGEAGDIRIVVVAPFPWREWSATVIAS